MRVLLAGDQPLLLEGLQNLLASQNYEVLVMVGKSKEVLAKAQEFKPKVLLNIYKPDHGGWETTHLIKTMLPDCQIIIFRSAEDEESQFEAINCEVSTYLLGSLQAEDLFHLLSELEANLPTGVLSKRTHD